MDELTPTGAKVRSLVGVRSTVTMGDGKALVGGIREESLPEGPRGEGRGLELELIPLGEERGLELEPTLLGEGQGLGLPLILLGGGRGPGLLPIPLGGGQGLELPPIPLGEGRLPTRGRGPTPTGGQLPTLLLAGKFRGEGLDMSLEERPRRTGPLREGLPLLPLVLLVVPGDEGVKVFRQGESIVDIGGRFTESAGVYLRLALAMGLPEEGEGEGPGLQGRGGVWGPRG